MEWAPMPEWVIVIVIFGGILVWSLLVGLTAYAAAYGWKEDSK